MLIITSMAFAQHNFRSLELIISEDTIQLDSLSIVPHSEIISIEGNFLDSGEYKIDYVKSTITFSKDFYGKRASIKFRVFPINFSKQYSHKSTKLLEQQDVGLYNQFSYTPTNNTTDEIFSLGEVNRSGTISRGLTVGNNQNLSVNSNLNLQLSGKVTEKINVLASITDDNIPIQPEGNTQQLQDFDQVYIQLYDDKSKLVAGDFQMKSGDSYFLKYYKRAQGGNFSSRFALNNVDSNSVIADVSVGVAVSKGKFSRNVILGVEGNQGPYRLKGSENETFIIVLSGTEKVFLDGEQMERGQDFDYIIDYNTAEITFTANRIITQYSRIVVEFQYSDKNYARSVMQASTGFEKNKWKVDLNMYSEQDAKNQPLQQELDDEQKQFLGTVGDSIQEALYYSIDSVPFENDRVLYKKIDTLVGSVLYDSVFVYSTNPDSAFYSLAFSLVGNNNGNYIQVNSTANGKVYQWVAPVSGIPQGNYEPVILLVTPKKRQLFTLGGEYNFSKLSKLYVEGAVSNYDANTFSKISNGDNAGYGFKLISDNAIPFSKEKNAWRILGGGKFEYITKQFKEIERYRSVEFYRDWSVRNIEFVDDQQWMEAYTGFEKPQEFLLKYTLATFLSGNIYNGLRHQANASFSKSGFNLKANGSYLETNGLALSKTTFYKHNALLSKDISWLQIGVTEEEESNTLQLNSNQAVSNNSFNYFLWKAYLKTQDSLQNGFSVSYQQREDKAPLNNELIKSTLGEDVEVGFKVNQFKWQKLSGNATYRRVSVLDSAFVNLKPEDNVVGKINYGLNLIKGTITSNTYYEVGSGLELKKEFVFIEVNPGQGYYQWIDYNDNGIKELNEFELAAFQDQANYIKVYVPTSEYVKTYTNQFNQVVFIKPDVVWSNKKGIRKFVSLFSNKLAFQTNRKTGLEKDRYNPFILNIDDSALVSQSSGIQNTFYFNRISSKYGAEIDYYNNSNKTLLTNGFETRTQEFYAARLRWNMTRKLFWNFLYKEGIKSNLSGFFTQRNYEFDFIEVEPKITFQPNVKFRINLFFNYQEKLNDENYGSETSYNSKIGTEMRLNQANKGSFNLTFNYVEIKYSGNPNSSVGFEMLEGLSNGKNYTWTLGYQRLLSNHLQLSLNYNGRAALNSKTIHTGGVQLRAFF